MASLKENVQMMQMLQGMDMREQELAVQKETQQRLMQEAMRKRQQQSSYAEAVRQALEANKGATIPQQVQAAGLELSQLPGGIDQANTFQDALVDRGYEEIKSGDDILTYPTVGGEIDPNALPIAAGPRWSPESMTPNQYFAQNPGYLEYLKAQGAVASEVVKTVPNIDKTLMTLKRMDNAVDNLNTGKLAGVKKVFRALADDFNLPIDIEQLSEAEALEAMSNEMALMFRNPESGYGLTGNTSNKDLEFLKSLPPSIFKSYEGNKLVIDYLRRVFQHKRDVAKETANYMEKNNTTAGLGAYMIQWAEDHPMFSVEDVDKLQETATPAPEVNYEELYLKAYQQGIPEEEIEAWVDAQASGGS